MLAGRTIFEVLPGFFLQGVVSVDDVQYQKETAEEYTSKPFAIRVP